MSIEAMGKQRPQTPPAIDAGEAQDGFLHGLAQHNAMIEHQPAPYTLDNGSYVHSGTSTTYGTPEPGQWYMDQYGNRSFAYHDPPNFGMDMPYDGYGQPFLQPHQGGVYRGHPLPQQHHYPNPLLHGRSPPTPNSDQSTPQRRATRPSRLAVQAESRRNSPKPKKAGGRNNAKPKTLSAPLSELTKDMKDIVIKDTETWVNRGVGERRQEAEKDNFIKRPSNSFILYRSAYADRARKLEQSANHQVVSSRAGESWAMEPPEIRKQYDEWAKIERENHAKAFPDYKFKPQTNKASSRKRKGRPNDSEEEPSDIESDLTYEPTAGGRPLRAKKSRRGHRETSYTPSGTSLEEYELHGFEGPGMYNSSFQASNPGKPLPAPLNSQVPHGQYYQVTSHPNMRLAYTEDVKYQLADAPQDFYDPTQSLIGFPGATHHELLGEVNVPNGLPTSTNPQVYDPMLLSMDQTHPEQSASLANEHANRSLYETTAPQAGVHQSWPYDDFDSGGEE